MTQPTDSGLKACPFCDRPPVKNIAGEQCWCPAGCTGAFSLERWNIRANTRPSAPADEAVKLAIEAIERTLHGHKKENCLLCEMRYGYAKLEGECHKCGLLDALTTLKNLEAKLNGGK